ncbi:MAG: glycosyltransferase [Deltaproteobacteria bacterium]|nr:glycosyltransferase [Deltaproteobacteria bacterium]
MDQPMNLLTPRTPPEGPPPAISVAVPVLDGGERLVTLAMALTNQVVGAGPIEILLADSGSTDGATERAAAACGARILDVAPGHFDHGLVRAALVVQARAPLVAFFSQDAVPRGERFLEALAAPFEDEQVAGAHARQVARPGADPLTRATLERWTPALGAPYVLRTLPPGGPSLPAAERMRLARFDNVASMVRRCHALDIPFPAREFGEDLAWGWATLTAGRSLAYVPSAVVEHSHAPTLRAIYERNVLAHRQASREFDLVTVPGALAGLIALASGVPSDLRDGGARWALAGIPRRAAALLGQWRGAQS